jgi:hypothetical protein
MDLQPKKKSVYTPTSTNYMKHTHAAEDYANRPPKGIETVFNKCNRATYFKF